MLQAEPIGDDTNARSFNPRSANSAMAASRIEVRVSIERCCSALLRGRSRRAAVSLVFLAISLSINIIPNRTPSKVLDDPSRLHPALPRNRISKAIDVDGGVPRLALARTNALCDPSTARSWTAASAHRSFAASLFPFENERRRFNVLVECVRRARKAALGVGTVVEFHRDVEHHKIRGSHTSA